MGHSATDSSSGDLAASPSLKSESALIEGKCAYSGCNYHIFAFIKHG